MHVVLESESFSFFNMHALRKINPVHIANTSYN